MPIQKRTDRLAKPDKKKPAGQPRDMYNAFVYINRSRSRRRQSVVGRRQSVNAEHLEHRQTKHKTYRNHTHNNTKPFVTDVTVLFTKHLTPQQRRPSHVESAAANWIHQGQSVYVLIFRIRRSRANSIFRISANVRTVLGVLSIRK